MTPPPGTLTSSAPTAAADSAAAVPVRAAGVDLLGQLEGSGYADARFFVRRGDGQTLHLTSLLYATLACIDGQRSYAQIAECITEQISRQMVAEDAQYLVEEKLRPLGLVSSADGSAATLAKANPLLGLRWRFVVSDPDTTRRMTRPFAALFRPYISIPLLLVFAALCGWVLLEKGLASATRDALYQPGLLLLILVLTMISAGFHEFGHAAACRYGGATPGTMGGGLYLVWPAFYTDVTDSYRLGRWKRVLVDVGGLYFNALFAIATAAAWWATRYDALLLIIPVQILQMLRQLLPFVRFDGYHILADMTGVPDLFAHIKPTLVALLPWRRRALGRLALKPWARIVVTAWALVVIPVLVLSLALMVWAMPRVAATAWDSLGIQATGLAQSWAEHAWTQVGLRLLAMFTIVLPVASMSYLLFRLVRRGIRRVWRATQHRPPARAASGVLAASVLALLFWAWWPEGQYRPIEADERGTLLDAVAAADAAQILLASVAPGVADDERIYALPTTDLQELTGPLALPEVQGATQLEPRLGVVFTPRQETADEPDAVEEQIVVLPRGTDTSQLSNGEFPFLPDEPREQDNQALALNTTDGSTLYDVSVAVVWVTDAGDLPVDHTNEAYALASCTDCTTVAVAFQVILIVGQADVVVPENVAVAMNYECDGCNSFALAVQLIATVTEMPSDEALRQLAAVWERVEELQTNIAQIPLDQLRAELAAIEDAILDILAADGTLASPLSDESIQAVASPTPTATPTDEEESALDDDAAASTEVEDDSDREAETVAEPTPTAESGEATTTDEETVVEPTAEPSPESAEEPVVEESPVAEDPSDTAP